MLSSTVIIVKTSPAAISSKVATLLFLTTLGSAFSKSSIDLVVSAYINFLDVTSSTMCSSTLTPLSYAAENLKLIASISSSGVNSMSATIFLVNSPFVTQFNFVLPNNSATTSIADTGVAL